GQALPGTNPLCGAGDNNAIDADLAPSDQSLQMAARELRSDRDDDLVQPLAVLRLVDAFPPRLERFVVGFAGGVRHFRGRACGVGFSLADHIRFAFDSLLCGASIARSSTGVPSA